MLPIKNRVRSWFFTKKRKPTFFVDQQGFSIKMFETDQNNPQIAVVIPKKIEKTAVKRNHLKRKIFSLFEKFEAQLPNFIYIIYLKNNNKESLLKNIEVVIKNKLLDK